MEELERRLGDKSFENAMDRIEHVESLVVAFRQKQDERGGQELKDMMSNLKNKYSFLAKPEEKENSSLATQIAVLEEKFTQLNSLVSSLNQNIQNVKNSTDALVIDKIKAVNFRIL